MDLITNYLGMELKNPLVAGASPMSRELDSVRSMEDAGIAAVVIYSLFQEQIEREWGAHAHFEDLGTYSFAESLTYSPSLDYQPREADDYLNHISHVKEAVNVPVIASLNGTSVGWWMEFARSVQQAGADAIELNIYHIATDPSQSAQNVEQRYFDVVAAVKEAVSIPVAVKLGPYFSSLANFATQLDARGADGLVLFNRFYQPDINLEALEVVPNLAFSAAHEMRLPLRWIAVLDPLVQCSLAATTGIYRATDVLKLLMAGADVTMLCAALLREGVAVIPQMLAEMQHWMNEHEYKSIIQLQGSMNHRATPDPAALERANYMRALISYQ